MVDSKKKADVSFRRVSITNAGSYVMSIPREFIEAIGLEDGGQVSLELIEGVEPKPYVVIMRRARA
jgi:antitoxin component of MazEF toxin-antitoxin module